MNAEGMIVMRNGMTVMGEGGQIKIKKKRRGEIGREGKEDGQSRGLRLTERKDTDVNCQQRTTKPDSPISSCVFRSFMGKRESCVPSL